MSTLLEGFRIVKNEEEYTVLDRWDDDLRVHNYQRPECACKGCSRPHNHVSNSLFITQDPLIKVICAEHLREIQAKMYTGTPKEEILRKYFHCKAPDILANVPADVAADIKARIQAIERRQHPNKALISGNVESRMKIKALESIVSPCSTSSFFDKIASLIKALLPFLLILLAALL